MHLRAALTIACACLALAASAALAADCKSTVNGDLRIHQLASKIFDNTRSIRVLLPPGYDAAENRSKRYPVLYMLDGQNLFVNKEYRTLTGHGNTALGGSSYGGVATLYALMARPTTFGYGLIESPSIWVGMGQLIRDTSPLAAFPRKVFMAFGAEEVTHGSAEKQVQGFFGTVVANFKAAGFDDNNFRYVYEQGAKHTESAWAKRLPDALKFLFADWKPQPEANDANK